MAQRPQARVCFSDDRSPHASSECFFLSVPRLNYEGCHCPRKIDRELGMALSRSYGLAALAVSVANFVPKGAKTFDHARAATENSLKRILCVLTRRDVELLRRCPV
jgi:hypothetical protein